MKAGHRAGLQAADHRMAMLEDCCKYAVAALKELHQMDLASKDAQVNEARALIQTKDDELDQAIRDAAKERREIKAMAEAEQHNLIKASKINRDAWSKEKEAMKHQMRRMNLDFEDALRAQKADIERLTKQKRSLKTASTLLFNALKGSPGMQQIQKVISDSEAMRDDLAKMQNKNKILAEKNENILEYIQRDRDHYEVQLKKEKDAQMHAYEVEKKVIELEDKLCLREELIRDLGKQVGASNNSQVLDQQHLDPSPSAIDAVNKALAENDQLRDRIESVLKEKAELQSEFNKLDTEDFSLLLKLDEAEARVHTLERENKVLRDLRTRSDEELNFLRNAIQKDGCLTVYDRADFGQHLCELTENNQALTKNVFDLTNEVNTYCETMRHARDKMDSEVKKANHVAEHYFTAYYDEAVPKVERLLEETRGLKIELGREVHVQEPVQHNPVADRAFLRCALEDGLAGVDPSLIPAECRESDFRADCIPATIDALRVLRPLGWIPVHDLDKVWLRPLHKPFTDGDAENRLLQAQGQMNSTRADMGSRPSEGTLYANSCDHRYTNANTEAPKDTPARKSTAPRPNDLVTARPSTLVQRRAPSQIPRPQPAAKPNMVAKVTKRPMCHAPAPKPVRQAARLTAPTAAYEALQAPPYRSFWNKKYNMPWEKYNQLEDDNKVDWVQFYVAKEDR